MFTLVSVVQGLASWMVVVHPVAHDWVLKALVAKLFVAKALKLLSI